MTSIQFNIPRRALGALDLTVVRQRGRAIGIKRASIEYNDRNAGHGRTRITCSIEMALVLIEEWRRLAEQAEARHETESVIDCAMAVKAAFDAIDEERKHPYGMASHIRPALN